MVQITNEIYKIPLIKGIFLKHSKNVTIPDKINEAPIAIIKIINKLDL